MTGHDSHGVVRFVEYTKWVQEGAITFGAPFEIIHESPSLAVVDAHNGWGMITAKKAMQLAMAKARESGVGTVAVRNGRHIGRLGEYSAMAAAAGMIGEVFVNSYGGRRIWWRRGVESSVVFPPTPCPGPLPRAATGRFWWTSRPQLFRKGKFASLFNPARNCRKVASLTLKETPQPIQRTFIARRGERSFQFGGIVGHKGYGSESRCGASSQARSPVRVAGGSSPS